MHYQGDLDGQGPVWGYVKGGMGMVSFAIADAAAEPARRWPAACRSREILPGEGVRLEDGELDPRPTVVCNADPKRALGDARRTRRRRRLPRAAGGVAGPQPGREVQRRAHRLPTLTAAPGEHWPARARST